MGEDRKKMKKKDRESERKSEPIIDSFQAKCSSIL